MARLTQGESAEKSVATTKDLQEQIVNARVWAGLHYRDSGEAGVDLGLKVAHWSLVRNFRPTH